MDTCIATYNVALTEVIYVMTLSWSDCGFKEHRGACRWVILPTPLCDVVIYIVLEV